MVTIKLCSAKRDAGRVYSLVNIEVPKQDIALRQGNLRFSLNRTKLRVQRGREGRFLLRSNLTDDD